MSKDENEILKLIRVIANTTFRSMTEQECRQFQTRQSEDPLIGVTVVDDYLTATHSFEKGEYTIILDGADILVIDDCGCVSTFTLHYKVAL